MPRKLPKRVEEEIRGGDEMKEPDQACPLIDKAIKNFKWVEREINNICCVLKNYHDLEDLANDIISWLEQIEFTETLEELRTRCSDLREWGNSWQTKAEKLEEELEEFKNKYEEVMR